ncbi:type VI secretion system membrane subunit TssM [Pseudoxanthomonas kalamensis]|uniref:type VI secretion system membrane subunit TssM n=1 Tax=Pseudoxanthomonas kalamensis TaxID=289483 RepID=UPI001FECB538|nr:type VI secretion system membrane subunit TssM [Pseudoxanthomonas kalamensis]
MSRFRYFLTDYRTLTALGLIFGGGVMFMGADRWRQIGFWLLVAAIVLLLVWLLVWTVKRIRARRAAAQLDDMVREQADRAVASAKPAARADTEVLREKMLEAVKAIKGSRLGHTHGASALYELPWYVIIGNPAAGKSTAILNSGLQFPFEDNRSNVVQGIGGTRNCDWYFTTEGIVLDTAGRYSVNAEDRLDWLTFLELLKKNRPMAPINGVIIAASIAELSGSKPEFAIELAKNLRQRVQELTERLEVFVPIYVVFTKADLIAGFPEFFASLDPGERENGWGATLPFDGKGETDALAAFDTHFDILSEGLREMALSQLALRRGRDIGPGLLTLPLEFTSLKPSLRTFIATLFEENPYQFKPVFRGFYFTSALQEGLSMQRASDRISNQFGLQARNEPTAVDPVATGDTGYFLKGLFRKVVFADRKLVRQYASPGRTRMRYAALLGSVALLAVVLAGWAWSYTSNRQFASNVAADLDKAVQVQQDKFDLKSRIEALLILQMRLEQLEQYRKQKPLSMGLGLYQGDNIEQKLRQEYFAGMQQVMLQPTRERLETFLSEVVGNGDAIRTAAGNRGSAAEAKPEPGEQLYQEASADNPDDAYNALKAYLMLGDPARVEATHLNAELTRFWRGWLEANRGQMPREDMIRDAERLMSFYVAQSATSGWPRIEPRFALVDDSRGLLREVMKGKPALERVYTDIKARAATRFPTITANYLIGEEANKGAITGNYAISGAFSREAWENYVQDAIKEASNTQLNTTDWVLETNAPTDLTLAGSPEHIQQELVALYKNEYAREWRKFLAGAAVAGFPDFETAVARMGSLGDVRNSPLRKLIEAVNHNTIWDNPQAESELMGKVRTGFVAWFERVIMRRNPTTIPVRLDPETGKKVPVPAGPVGREFAGLARLALSRDGSPSMLDAYFEALGKIRGRLNAIRTQGEPGPGAGKLMQETLSNGDASELAAALKLVDEQMLDGVEDEQRQVLRALLLRPLTQTYAALVAPTEGELNRTWTAQVYQPFQNGIAQRYPFAPNASVEAMRTDIEQVFGPNGSIAQFGKDALGTLVTRRGNQMEPARWADIGIGLSPEFTTSYASWVAPLGQVGSGGGGAAAESNGRMFRIQPQPVAGVNEYSIEIDGQLLRYRNTPPQWQSFRWPGPGTPGARVSATVPDGSVVELVNAPGSQGLGKLFDAAEQETLGDNHYRLTWRNGNVAISVELQVVSAPVQAANDSGSVGGLSPTSMRGLRLPTRVAGAPAAAATPTAAATSTEQADE